MALSWDEGLAEILFLIYHKLKKEGPLLSHLNRGSTVGIRLEQESADNGGVYDAGAG